MNQVLIPKVGPRMILLKTLMVLVSTKNCDSSSFYKKVPLSPTNAAAYRTEWTRHEEQVRKQQEPYLTVISICRLESNDLISGGVFMNLKFGELFFKNETMILQKLEPPCQSKDQGRF